MNIRDRIKKLEGLRKEALNFKLFKKIWPKYQESNNDNASLDAEKAFDLYQRGLLERYTQMDIEKFDKQTSLYDTSPTSYRETRLSLESEDRYKEILEKRMIAEQESAKRQMMSGRHSEESFIPTSYLNKFDPFDNQIRMQSLGPKESPIKTVSETGELIHSGTMGSEAGSVWAPYILLYKGSKSIVARQYANPNEARWVSSHPDISSSYGKRSGGEGFLEVYDLRKVPKEKRNFFTKHIAKDTRGMSEDEITEAILNGNSEWRSSPYYEAIIEDGDLIKARIAKYKSLPGLGWMLVEGRNILKEGLTKEEAREHLDILKSEAGGLAKENPKMYFYYNLNKIMDRDLTIKALKAMSEKHPYSFLTEYREEALSLDLDLSRQALEALAKQQPNQFLTEYREEASELGFFELIKIAIEALAKQNPYSFLANYREEARDLGLVKSTKIAFETLAKQAPQSFLFYYKPEALSLDFIESIHIALEALVKQDLDDFLFNYIEEAMDLGFVDLVGQALEALAKQDPGEFIRNYIEEAKRLGLVDLENQALEGLREYAKRDPDSFLDKYRGEVKNLGFVESIQIALESLANQSPSYFLGEYREEAMDLGFTKPLHIAFEALANQSPAYFLGKYIEEAMGLGFTKPLHIAFEALAKQDPRSFLDKYIEEAMGLGFVDLVVQALEALAKQDPGEFIRNYIEEAKSLGLSINQVLEEFLKLLEALSKYPNIFLTHYINEAKSLGLVDLIKQVLEAYAKQNPHDFLSKYKEEAQNLGLDPDELVSKQASLSNHLVKLSRALESIGMTKEASRVRYLLNIR